MALFTILCKSLIIFDFKPGRVSTFTMRTETSRVLTSRRSQAAALSGTVAAALSGTVAVALLGSVAAALSGTVSASLPGSQQLFDYRKLPWEVL